MSSCEFCEVFKNNYFVERLYTFVTMFFYYNFRVNNLKIFAKVKKNTCAGVSVLIKLQASRLELYSERDSGANVFL